MYCCVTGCKTNSSKHPDLMLRLPLSGVQKHRWQNILKNKSVIRSWNESKICSKHFDSKYFDKLNRLKDNAVPTIFPVSSMSTVMLQSRSTLDAMLSKKTEADLWQDIKEEMKQLGEPENLMDFMTENCKCKKNAPLEAKLWCLLKKQHHLNTRLLKATENDKKHVDILQADLEDAISSKKEMEKTLENYKYINKGLQEKQSTLEEQIEILTAFESR